MIMNKGLIIGKGWLGNRLENYLKSNYQLTTTKRISDAENCISIDFDENQKPLHNIYSFNFIVITIPFGKRNTIKELENRFSNLIHFLNDFSGQIILISSTGIYPDSDNLIEENSYLDKDLNKPYITIENLVKSHYPQLTILRLGGIMGDDRYLSKYLKLDREDLNEVVNHIHFQDILEVIRTCIEKDVRGKIINVVAPQHPTKKQVLEFQINNNLINSDKEKGKSISSEKLINELNYHFIHPNPLYFKD